MSDERNRCGCRRPTGAFSTPALAETIHGTLYKDQHCECCEAHAEYLQKNGFDLKIESVNNP